MDNKVLNLNSKANLNCSICDRCCKYRGDIRLTPINVLEISKYLKITPKSFLENYTIELEDEPPEIVIKAVSEERRCIFNNSKNYKCMIHKFRPMQCVVFPLYPVDIKNDLFINTNFCIMKSNKKTKINKWLNSDNLYKKNKNIYLKWIELIEEIQPIWNSISANNKRKIKELLFIDYDLNKNYEKQIIDNFKKVRDIIYN